MIRSRLAHLCVLQESFAPISQHELQLHKTIRRIEAIHLHPHRVLEPACRAAAFSSTDASSWRQQLHLGPALHRQLPTSNRHRGVYDFSAASWSWLGFAAAAAGVTGTGGWVAYGDSRAGQQQQQLQQQRHQGITSSSNSATLQKKAISLQQPSATDRDSDTANSSSTAHSSSGLLSDAVRQLVNWYDKAEAWLVDILQQSSDEHVVVKLLALSLALLPVIVASGAIYTWASGVPISQALYKMYCLLYRVEAGQEPNIASYLVTNAVFMLGFFTLALLLGELTGGMTH
eukprot:GHUV01028842.1.p1 GENE.GHUV01028842.1~~GHUV01028842.1.p1  ORF type:complete len:288 (+),score=92.01 GHUV01028842.1:34-897(+)